VLDIFGFLLVTNSAMAGIWFHASVVFNLHKETNGGFHIYWEEPQYHLKPVPRLGLLKHILKYSLVPSSHSD
jgi:hypothetical protein